MTDTSTLNPKTPELKKFDFKTLRNTLGNFATGVTVVSFDANGQPAGMTANAFMSVSLDPALIVISVREKSRLNDFVRLGDSYGVSILNTEQEPISNHFGGRPIDDLHIDFEYVNDIPLIKDSLAHFVAKTVDIHKAGDHYLLIGEIQYINSSEEDIEPLLFYKGQYR